MKIRFFLLKIHKKQQKKALLLKKYTFLSYFCIKNPLFNTKMMIISIF